MKNILISAVAAGAIISFAGAAAAQQIYLNFGPNPGYGPPPGPYYRSERLGRGYYRPGRFRTGNGCQQGWTVQDGLCKPYRGY